MLRSVIRMLRRAGALGLAVVLLVALPLVAVAQAHDGQSGGGDGGGDDVRPTVATPPPAVVPPPGAPGPSTASVTIANFAFGPATISVVVGGSVSWTNTDPDTHTATGTGFDTGNLAPGASRTIPFPTAGTFAYHCNIHSSMHGSVVVAAAGTTPPPNSPPPATPPPATPPPSGPPAPSGPASVAVSMASYAFNPASVSVMVGGTITWTNTDPDTHTATGAGFDTGNLAPGASRTIPFPTAGTFAYHCNIHSGMKGTVVVVTAGTLPPPNAAVTPAVASTIPSAPGRTPAATAPSGPVAPTTAAVSIANYAFAPASISVAVGGHVIWTNTDGDAHTATGGGFDTGTLTPHATRTVTFPTAGTFAYHCSIHSTMHGTVVVLAKDAPLPPAGAGGDQGSGPTAQGTLTRAVSQAGGVGGSAGVTIVNYAFAPSTLSIHAGDRVTWVNKDPAPHTASGAGFDTGMINPGSSASATFATEGTFAYHCNVHPIMTATIHVVPSSAAVGTDAVSLVSAGSGTDPGAAAPADPGAGTQVSAAPAPAGGLHGATPEEFELLARDLAHQQGILPSLPPLLLAVLCVGLGMVIASRVLPGRGPTKTL